MFPPVGKSVILTRPHTFARQGGVILAWCLLIASTCFTPTPALGQSTANQNSATQWDTLSRPSHMHDDPSTQIDAPQPLNNKLKAILKANFEKTKADAAEMAGLAKELGAELSKPNADAHSLQVVNLAEKIEKLAKKIRGEMKGF
jgi:hypothetical protein